MSSATIADPAGWIVAILTVVLAWRWRVFGGRGSIRTIVIAAVLIRTAYSLANVAVGPLFGLEFDAQGFHLEAVKFAQGGGVPVGFLNGAIYSVVVGGLYRVTGGGLLLGQQLSVLAVVLSAASIVRIMTLFDVQRRRIAPAMFVVLFLPSAIVNTSGTLREAFQQLFFVLTVEAGLKLIRVPRLKYAALMALTTIVGGSLHAAVAVGSATVAAGAILVAGGVHNRVAERDSPIVRRLLPFGLVAVLVAGVSVPTVLFPYEISDGALAAVSRYRASTPPARADYLRNERGVELSTSDIPVLFVLYEVAPLPWQVANFADAVAAAEALVRIVLILMGLLALVHSSRGASSRLLRALLIAGGWLAMETVWALGTTNWGTGSRHHVVAFPLLVVLAALAPAAVHRRVHVPVQSRSIAFGPTAPIASK